MVPDKQCMGYAVIKIFFANLKRGGILLIMISVGSLYLFSVPRGYIDGFVSWCKQIVGLCLTAFLQSVMLVAGLMVFPDKVLLGLGLMPVRESDSLRKRANCIFQRRKHQKIRHRSIGASPGRSG